MLTENRKGPFAAALLSLSLLTIMAGAGVAPALHKIAAAFPETSPTVIKLIVSLPSLVMIVASLLCGVLLRFMGQRTLIISGLLLFVVGGVGAGFMESMPILLLCRALLGLGAGIILPFSTGLVAVCYEEGSKVRMMGYASAANALGASVSNLLAGYWALVSWRHAFHVYWLGALSLLLVVFFLRDLPARTKPQQGSHLPGSVYLFGGVAMLLMMALFLLVTNLPFLVEQKGIGSSELTGYLFAVNSLFILSGGILLPRLLLLGRFFLPVAMSVFGLGMLAVAQASSPALLYLGSAISGLGFGTLYPYFLDRITGSTARDQAVKAMAVGMAFTWFGQFLSPLVFGALTFLFKLDGSGPFLLVSVVVVLLALIQGAFLAVQERR